MGGKGTDSRVDEQTGPSRRGRTNGQTGRLGLHCTDGGSGGRADEGVGLGLKGHILRGPFHSWAPSPLASSERGCAGCLGVQWGPRGFPVKHPYLAPGLTCLV